MLQWWNSSLSCNQSEALYTSIGKSSHVNCELFSMIASLMLNDKHDTWFIHLRAHSETKPTRKELIFSTFRTCFLYWIKYANASFGPVENQEWGFSFVPNTVHVYFCVLYHTINTTTINRKKDILGLKLSSCLALGRIFRLVSFIAAAPLPKTKWQ